MNLVYTLLGAAFLLVSCSSDENNDPNSTDLNSLAQEISEEIVSGSWMIASFIDSGSDETSNFAGYVFTFNQDGSLTATNSSGSIDGSWSVTFDDDDDSSDDSPDDPFDDIDFNIFFASPDDFSELTEDWEIVSRSGSQIELIHVSGGDGSTDTLTLVKT